MPRDRREEVPDGFAVVGRVLSPFGVKGDVKVDPLGPESAFGKGKAIRIGDLVFTVERYRPAGRIGHLKLAGVNFRDQAEDLRGHYLLVPEAELDPPGEDRYYHFQLIGLPVVSTEGEPLGEIADILTTGSNDVFVLKGPRGEVLIPVIEDIVRTIDVKSRIVTVEVVPGLLPD